MVTPVVHRDRDVVDQNVDAREVEIDQKRRLWALRIYGVKQHVVAKQIGMDNSARQRSWR
jgi:hypothetical protein